MATEFVSRSNDDTIAFGRRLAEQLGAPVLVLLSGELGAGKTTLAKGIISGLGAAREEDVTSPTFKLVHVFNRPAGGKVYHVDLYRISDSQDLESLGLDDVFSEPAIVLVEWPERLTIRNDWPVTRIALAHAGDDSRRIQIL